MKRCRHIELKDPALMMLSFTITRKICLNVGICQGYGSMINEK